MDREREKILLDQAREGDEASFEQLILAHTPRVVNLAFRLVGHREQAEDIAQEAFLRLHRSLDTFRGDSSLGTWLYRTVSRLSIDYLRREQLKRKLFFFRSSEEEPDPVDMAADPGQSPADQLQARETQARLQKALGQLSARQRTIFTLRHFEELPLKEIAQILDLEEGTVKSHLHRAVTIIRRELHDLREAL